MSTRISLSFQLIIETAAALADKEGLENVTLTLVAEHLGVRKPSLYNHVDGLAKLQQGLAIFAMKELQLRISQAAIGKAKQDALRAIAIAYRAFAHERPGLYRAIVATPDRESEELKKAIHSLMNVIAVVLEAYSLSEAAATHALRGLRSIMHGFVALEAAGWFIQPLEKDESYIQLIDTFIRGIEAL